MANADVPDARTDAGIPPNLRYIGIVVGLLLLCGGFGAMFISNKLYGVGVLLVCVGFGITLAVFGSQASGKFLSFNMVGGGATAVALYLLLYSYPIHPFESYLRGKIERTDMLVSVAGQARQSFFVGRPREKTDFEFIIFENEIASPQLYFLFQFPEDSPAREIYIGCIDSKLFGDRMGGEAETVLTLEPVGNEGKYELVDNETGRAIGQFNQKRCGAEPKIDLIPIDEVSFNLFSISAYAGVDEAAIVQEAIPRLDSEDASQRDDARTQLAALEQPESYRAVASSWNIRESSYRQDLGRLIAWSSAIKRDRKTAVYIANSLSPEQLSYLAQLTGQGDITLRQSATEVLHRLLETTSWPSGPPPDQAKAIVTAVTDVLRNPDFPAVQKSDMSFNRENRLYNTIVAIGFTECNIGPAYRAEIAAALSELAARLADAENASKTLRKLKSVQDTLKSCPA